MILVVMVMMMVVTDHLTEKVLLVIPKEVINLLQALLVKNSELIVLLIVWQPLVDKLSVLKFILMNLLYVNLLFMLVC